MSFITPLLLAVALFPQVPGVPQPPAVPAPQQPVVAPGTAQAYIIGPEDQLTITVFDHDDLTNKYRVDADGSISFPLVGRIAASGLTLGQLQDRLRTALAAGYIRNPQLRVDIQETDFKSQSVIVTGEVRTPGEVKMTGTMTLLTALARAGSPTSSASNVVTIAHTKRPGAPGASASENGGDDLVRVNWKDLQIGKVPDLILHDGDVINVPPAERFYMSGSVRNPGFYVLDPGMTVEQAIALAGGLHERGSTRGIVATRVVNGKTLDVPLKLSDKVVANDTIKIRQRMF
jgi:polysaccharide export outer membrane protein